MSDTKDLTFPTIHLNGSGAKQLAEALEEAYRTLDVARDALQKTAPHGRDYYVQEGDAFLKARNEFQARQQALAKVQAELLAIYQAVEKQYSR